MVNEEGDEKWGFVDKTGKVVINPQFISVSNFSNGKCGVRNDEGNVGVHRQRGKDWSSTINLMELATFKMDNVLLESGNKAGVIDKDGKYIINPQFSSMQIDGDLFHVVQRW